MLTPSWRALGALAVLLQASLLTSCVELPSDEEAEIGELEQAFLVWDSLSTTLMPKVKGNSTIGICLEGDGVTAAADRTRYEGYIRDAIGRWVDGMRPVATSGTTLITRSAVVFDCANRDLTVKVLKEEGRSRASGDTITIRQGRDDLDEVVLHEFGHAFGLLDTYVEGGSGCQPGQASSVMCDNVDTLTLQLDDLLGIQEAFCAAFPANCKRRWEASLNWCKHANGRVHIGDFNGDHHDDMLCHDVADGRQWIAYASADGKFTGTNWKAPSTALWCFRPEHRLHVGDFNGDKRTDMFCHDVNSGAWWVALATTSGTFTGTTWQSWLRLGFCASGTGKLHVGDFNGDGHDDMLCYVHSSRSVSVALSASSGDFTTNPSQGTLTDWCNDATGQVLVGDFNNDGRDDILCHDVSSGSTWSAALASENRPFATSWTSTLSWCAATSSTYVGDFDDDGAADVLCHNPPSGRVEIALAQEYVVFPAPVPTDLFVGTARGWSIDFCKASTQQLLVGDFNGDGASDFMCHDKSTGKKWIVYMWSFTVPSSIDPGVTIPIGRL